MNHRTKLDDFHLIVVILRYYFDNSSASLSALLAGVLVLLGPADHEAVVMLEHSRVIKFDRNNKVHFGDGCTNCGFQQHVEHFFIAHSGHSISKRLLIESDITDDGHLVLRYLNCLGAL